ncbi:MULTISPECIES: hypothetical protein [Streptomyces]|uniref:Phage tail assembly protein n=1 Tax=Streptomyces doudnae TaxID=3075536 RepID=A0ABD5EMT2_9ACTN|nr:MULTISPECIES: hypothetical protein [unclassified Streptomyces]MDT0435603.1 hypothetical protein [Streptomyces sp. DSM 41981]MYQ62558.1 hypothetical protein [Streptomyces sp. SID4950]SCD39931.1 hypothetical protein GA0115242_104862 [Streptomyces sp. SolWspMP-5a-2]
MRHALPSGNWVELRDPADLRRADKKRALKLVGLAEESELTLATEVEMADGVICMMIAAWSFELPMPATADSLGLLSLADSAAVEKLPEIKAAHKLIFPEQAEATPEQVADPESPTEPSAG